MNYCILNSVSTSYCVCISVDVYLCHVVDSCSQNIFHITMIFVVGCKDTAGSRVSVNARITQWHPIYMYRNYPMFSDAKNYYFAER